MLVCFHMLLPSPLLPSTLPSLCYAIFSSGIDPRPAVFGVVRRLGDMHDDDEAHSNQQVREDDMGKGNTNVRMHEVDQAIHLNG